MCDNCGKFEGTNKIRLISMHPSLVKVIEERNIKEVVKNQGHLVIATLNSDYDEKGNFIGDYSKEFEIAKKYERKHFPERFVD